MNGCRIGGRITVIGTCVVLAGLVCWSAPSVGQEKPPALKPLELKVRGAEAADPTAPLVVPDGKPEELLKFIEKLAEDRPPKDAPDEVVKAFITARLRAMATAGAKVLAAKPTEEQALAATRARLSALVGLENLDDAGAAKQIEGLPAELTAAGHPKLARAVGTVILQRRLQEAQKAGPKELKQAVDEIGKFLAAGPVGRSDVGLAMRTAMMLEQSGDAKLAVEAYAAFGKVLKANKDKVIAGFGERMEGAGRRLALPGNPLEIEGTLLGGKKLDWSQFGKKTVLVMFWATWCGPCNAELPNVKKLYEEYHAKGFDVVGISCDDDQKKLEAFVKDKEIPWTILFSGDPEATGMDNPMALKYGVMGVPTMILVGPDGKVVSLAARGPNLARELAKLYGPPEKKGEDKKDAEKKG